MADISTQRYRLVGATHFLRAKMINSSLFARESYSLAHCNICQLIFIRTDSLELSSGKRENNATDPSLRFFPPDAPRARDSVGANQYEHELFQPAYRSTIINWTYRTMFQVG